MRHYAPFVLSFAHSQLIPHSNPAFLLPGPPLRHPAFLPPHQGSNFARPAGDFEINLSKVTRSPCFGCFCLSADVVWCPPRPQSLPPPNVRRALFAHAPCASSPLGVSFARKTNKNCLRSLSPARLVPPCLARVPMMHARYKQTGPLLYVHTRACARACACARHFGQRIASIWPRTHIAPRRCAHFFSFQRHSRSTV
jgi:hypothetical protein